METCGTLPLSEELYLRPFNEEDATAFHALIEANRARLATWLPWAADQTLDDTAEFIRRKGTMTLAVQALVNHALSVWHLNRVEIRPADENRRSRAIPERLGFSQDGILRSAELVNGRYLDVVVYSMLAADWCAEQTP